MLKFSGRSLQGVALVLLFSVLAGAARAGDASFAKFDQDAKSGAKLNVVFFGASLTWGANATDPQLTSYRAEIANRLEKAYPKARFKFWDAAIGGTGSQLGVFRFERDVLRHKPDLVFLDFSANDDIYSPNPESLASYESLVRRIIVDAKVPVVQVIFPFQWNVAPGNTNGMVRRDAHLAIGKAYQVPVGDAIALAIERVKSGEVKIEQLWPTDGVHPGDQGYQLFADAAWDAFQLGVKNKLVCTPPKKMLNADTYMTNARVRISQLKSLPPGWKVSAPNLVSAYFDMLMSRWLDDETVVDNQKALADKDKSEKDKADNATKDDQPDPNAPPRLKVNFHGSMVMIFGESTPKSGQYRAYVDGKLVERTSGDGKPLPPEFDAGALGKILKGNTHLQQVIVEGLDPAKEHTLEIEPVFVDDAEQELRFESICVAGGKAEVHSESNGSDAPAAKPAAEKLPAAEKSPASKPPATK